MNRLTLMLPLAVLLAGCPEPLESELFLNAMSAAPPTLTAEVHNPYEGDPSITITAGAGLGLSCTEICRDEDDRRPDCAGARYAVEPASLGTVYPVTLPGRDGAVLLIAGEPGTGALTVSTSCAEKRYRLRVE